MTNGIRNESAEGPLRHFRVGRRAVLQTLAGGVGAAVFATQAAAAHSHHAAITAGAAASATTTGAESAHLFLDNHAFDSLSLLAEQIVPGSRDAGVPAFLDRLLAVESTDTQKNFMQALGSFEKAAREANGVPWKMLTADQSTALLTKISTTSTDDPSRKAFDAVKGAVSETYFATEAGLKELGWNGGVAFAPPPVCP